jgi:hypothetical protein
MTLYICEFGSLSSKFLILPVLVPEAPTTTKDNNRIALGVGLGVSLSLVSIAVTVLIAGVVGAVICIKKKSAKRYAVYSWKV